MSTNRIADLGQTVTVTAGAGVVQVADQKMQAFIISAMPEDTAPQARSLKDFPNFVVVEKSGRIVEVQELISQITASIRGVQGPPGPSTSEQITPSGLTIGGIIVVAAQQPAVANVAAHTVSSVDLATAVSTAQTAIDDLKTQLNAILARLRAHGLIA